MPGPTPMQVLLVGLLLLLSLAGAPRLAAEIEDEISLGPLAQEFSLTLQPGIRYEAAGPIFHDEYRGDFREWAVSPLMSEAVDLGVDSHEFDVAYPLITYDRYGPEQRFQILQLVNWSAGESMNGTTWERYNLFPFVMLNRSSDPSQNYTAFFPFYGQIKNRVFRDELKWVMWPLYVQSKQRRGGVVTDNFLFPVFHLRHGPGVTGWQFWPLIGFESKVITTRTNVLDEPILDPGHEKMRALWPIFSKSRTGIGTSNVVDQLAVLPLYSSVRSPALDATQYLWPFFSFLNNKATGYHEWGAPWPFVVFGRGPQRTVDRFWPLFGHTHTPDWDRQTYLWPVYIATHATPYPLDRKRVRVGYFVYNDVLEKNRAAGTSSRWTALWPLFMARREHNGSERLQLLAVLEPIFPANKAIARNYSSLWSLWRYERNAATGATSRSALFNLFRLDTEPERKKCSLLFGLFQYQSSPEGRRVKVFFIPFGKGKAASPPAPGPR